GRGCGCGWSLVLLGGGGCLGVGLGGGVGDGLGVGAECSVSCPSPPEERRPCDPGEVAFRRVCPGDFPAGVPVAAGESGGALVGVHRSSSSWWAAGPSRSSSSTASVILFRRGAMLLPSTATGSGWFEALDSTSPTARSICSLVGRVRAVASRSRASST